MSDAGDRIYRQDARLRILETLAGQADERLNSDALAEVLEDRFGIRRTRDWLLDELAWLRDMGAVRLVEAGSLRIACLTQKGADHLARVIAVEGIKRPAREG